MTNISNQKKILYIITGTVIMLLAGLLYGWSLFVTPLEAEFSWDRSHTSLIFTISIIAFSIGNIISGAIHRKVNVRLLLFLSGVMVCTGFFLSAQVSRLFHLYMSYGCICGFGIGLIYNNVVSMVTSWFPRATGKVSGILLMGYGLGAFCLGSVASMILETLGWRIAFRVIAVIFVMIVTAGAVILKENQSAERQPKEEIQDTVSSYTPFKMMKTSLFIRVYLWSFLITAIGFTVIGNVAPCSIFYGAGTWLSVIAVGCVSAANGAGRLVMGAFFDRLGAAKTFRIIGALVIAGVALLLAGSVLENLPVLFAGFFVTVCAFSGLSPANPVIARRVYGPKYYSINLSLYTSTGLPGSILGAYCMGVVLTYTGSYAICFGCCAVLAVIAVSIGESASRIFIKAGK